MRRAPAILTLAAGLLALSACAHWRPARPPVSPPARSYHAMAYIGGDQVVMFGGERHGSSSPHHFGDTWVYDLSDNTWVEITGLDESPEPRMLHAMAHIGEYYGALFGGRHEDGRYLDSLWIFTRGDNVWSRGATKSSQRPPPRWQHAMAYIGGQKIVVYGGYTNGAPYLLQDVWVYDLPTGQWTEMQPAEGPGPRKAHAMAYLGDDKVLMFGGNVVEPGSPVEVIPANDTWVYDLSDDTWTEIEVEDVISKRPGKRWYHMMAHASAGQAILFGGRRDHIHEPVWQDTWKFVLATGTWIRDSDNRGKPEPSARAASALARTSADGSSDLVLFSGDDGTVQPPPDDTWLYGPRPDGGGNP